MSRNSTHSNEKRELISRRHLLKGFAIGATGLSIAACATPASAPRAAAPAAPAEQKPAVQPTEQPVEQKPAEPTPEPLRTANVNGVVLHYTDHGQGVPVVFVHGGLVDYRRWAPQIEPFAEKYRIITYSRRNNFPNENVASMPNHSAIVEADDLAALLKELGASPAYVVGESYGAFTALFLAVNHPDAVRGLVLAEAPIQRWLDDTPEGKVLHDEFKNGLWKPAGQAFSKGDRQGALNAIVHYFTEGAATPNDLPAEVRAELEANLHEWEVLTAAQDPFPMLSPEDVKKISVPALMLSGENTLKTHKILDAQIEKLLPNVSRMVIPGATHEMWAEQPDVCREKTMAFLASLAG